MKENEDGRVGEGTVDEKTAAIESATPIADSSASGGTPYSASFTEIMQKVQVKFVVDNRIVCIHDDDAKIVVTILLKSHYVRMQSGG